MQGWLGLRDPREFGLLPGGQVLGVLPQREPGVLQRLGVSGRAVALPRRAARPQRPGVTARGVPGLSPDLVQCVGGPLHDVERVGAADRLRASLGDDLADPGRTIGTDVGDLGTAFGPQCVEERPHGRLVPSDAGPDQAAGVVVDHDGEVLVVALVGDLIDSDPPQAGEQIQVAGGVGPYARDDRADGAPGDPHQLRDRGLRALRGQPGDLLVEQLGVPGAVAGPRDLPDCGAMTRAVHSRRVCLEEHLDGAEIESSPPSASFATVVPGSATSALPATPPGCPRGSHMSDHHLGFLVELDVLDDRLLDAQQGTP